MKLSSIVLTMMIYLAAPLYAAEREPLNVAVDTFSPGFVIQGGNKQFFGFDIEMMQYICDKLNRRCNFQPMAFSKLINSILQNSSEVAVGSIVINTNRLSLVNFSIPYMNSQGRVVALKKTAPPLFTLKSLGGQKIGIEEGSMFPEVLESLPIDKPTIITYPTVEAMIAGLSNGEITYAMAPNPIVMFWLNQTSGDFVALGQPFDYGYGLGIAITKNNPELLNQINQALAAYMTSPQFKQSYNTYLQSF